MVRKLIAAASLITFTFPVFSAKVDRPNIIFMMCDDLGPEWIGAYGADEIKTPNIDKMAETGLQFNGAYSMPKCTPSRATFLTGQYPWRNGWVNHWDVPRWSPRKDGDAKNAFFDWDYNITIARVMKSRGYATAAAGKWQINDFEYQPMAMEKHGFDEWSMWIGGPTSRYWSPEMNIRVAGDQTSKTAKHKDEYGPEMTTDFIVDFLTRHKDEPMFIYYPEIAPHSPWVTTPFKRNASGTKNKHIAMTEYIDHSVGRIMSRLDSLGIADKTIFIFTTDNGSSSGLKTKHHGGIPIEGGKGDPTENGSWEPFIVWGPGLVPVGKTNVLTDFSDMFPTFADLAHAKIPDNWVVDGVSIAKVLTGESTTGPRGWIMAQGGKVSKYVNNIGIKPEFKTGTRQMRDLNFKVYVNTNKAGDKFEIKSLHRVDSIIEGKEGPDLKNSSDAEAVAAMAKFNAIIDSLNMPLEDHWPTYRNSKSKFMPSGPIKYDPPLDTTDYTVGIADRGPRSVRQEIEIRYGQDGLSVSFDRALSSVKVDVVNASGKVVNNLVDGSVFPGQVFRPKNALAPGVYAISYSSELGSMTKTLYTQW